MMERYSMNQVRRFYDNIPIDHDAHDVGVIQRVLEEYKPKLVVELGTKFGGLTLAMADAAPEAVIATFDKSLRRDRRVIELLEKRNPSSLPVYFHKCDILESDKLMVRSWLEREERKFLYCDNGNKVREIILYAKYLRPGDLLGVHDWGTEIHSDHTQMSEKWQAINPKKNIDTLNCVLNFFTPIIKGRQTLIWRRIP